MTPEQRITQGFPGWEFIKFEYGRWTATHKNYDVSWEGEEDGWCSNGLMAEGRTLEELAEDMDSIEIEKGLSRDSDGTAALCGDIAAPKDCQARQSPHNPSIKGED